MRALIFGITGQDGSYLAKFLLEKGYEVVGTSRDANTASLKNLYRLGIYDKVTLVSTPLNDFRSILLVIQKYLPDEVYNLAGQSSVGLSYLQPAEAVESISFGTLNILEAIRMTDHSIYFYNAGSSECFGNTGSAAADECTPFFPRSPYAVAKSSAYWLVKSYRDAYGMFASTGILFNHESPLRPQHFVTQKIVSAAASIARTGKGCLELGNIDIYRDWGWAPEYVEAMWLMLQQNEANDYVIATGRSCSLRYFVELSFNWFSLAWQEHVVFSNRFIRPSEIVYSRGSPALAAEKLGWVPVFPLEAVIDSMCAEANRIIVSQLA